ncbi:MAG: FHA domain-containing protein [Deltaproteobacteria bacterium]|nr:FHA domain-containing protein [Deltaproteobacteria bacterium]
MPTLIVHELNQPARKAPFLVKSFRIGRDPHNELVLSSPTVSREHALIRMDAATGNWFISCVSQTNPVVVDGQLVTQTAWVREGSEILIGSDHLILFSENEQRAAGYQAGQARFVKNVCSTCQWSGMISSLRRDAICPKCGSKTLHAADAYVAAATHDFVANDATSAMDLDQVRASLRQLKTAKRSHIERLDDWSDGGERHDLSETEPLYIGRAFALKLRGFVFGKVKIAWTGRRWQLTNELIFGGLQVNGKPVKETLLRDGDEIDVGSSRFKVVTE